MNAQQLTDAQRQRLLALAREALAAHVERGERIAAPHDDPTLCEPRGAFVTLRRGRALRGCIGSLSSTEPLADTIVEMAIAAASRDVRFPPVRPDELDALHIELSVLGPLQDVPVEQRPEAIRVGQHGVVVEQGWSRGVLLPQVAVEYGWDAPTFLAHTCLKAGLAQDAWKEPDTRVQIFTAEVFGEPR